MWQSGWLWETNCRYCFPHYLLAKMGLNKVSIALQDSKPKHYSPISDGSKTQPSMGLAVQSICLTYQDNSNETSQLICDSSQVPFILAAGLSRLILIHINGSGDTCIPHSCRLNRLSSTFCMARPKRLLDELDTHHRFEGLCWVKIALFV